MVTAATLAVAEQSELDVDKAAFLDGYRYVDCRENRHGGPNGWRLLHEDWVVQLDHRGMPVWTKTYQCQTCGTKRIKRRTRYGKLGTRYHYDPDRGYLARGMQVTASDVEQWEIDQQEARAARRSSRRRRRAS